MAGKWEESSIQGAPGLDLAMCDGDGSRFVGMVLVYIAARSTDRTGGDSRRLSQQSKASLCYLSLFLRLRRFGDGIQPDITQVDQIINVGVSQS